MNTNPFKAEGQRVLGWSSNLDAQDEPVPKAEGVSSEKVALAKQAQTDNRRTKQLEKFSGITSLDWRQIPPPMMAELIMATPQRGKTGEPDYYLEAYQAYRFAIRAYEIGLSPLSTEVWYNPQNNMTNVTFEGKLKLSRLNKLNLGPARFEEIHRPFPKGKQLAGFDQDLGIKCKMSTARTGEDAEYTAWLSEWFVSTSPVWKAKPNHMLMVRSAEKCLSFASGLGVSELMDDRDLVMGPTVAEVMPEVMSTDFQEVKQPTK